MWSLKSKASCVDLLTKISYPKHTLVAHRHFLRKRTSFAYPSTLIRYTSTMPHNIPDKQWAQVIEKTGGPVDYKQIPGKTYTAYCSSLQD